MPSRSTKISLLLAVDVVFFFIEIITGYAVGSLALVADSFHMLNDVLSLIVALYAIKLSKNDPSPQYSYGWHRAEIVAALVNGVFLLALCFSICMEAIERFFNPPEISNAKLVVIVGSLGLASNFFGLFLFHEHSHSHDTPAKPKVANRKAAGSTLASPQRLTASPAAGAPNPVPGEESLPRRDSFNSLYGHPAATRASVVQAAQDIGYGRPTSPTTPRKIKQPVSISHERSSSSASASEGRMRNSIERDEPHRQHGDVLINIEEGEGAPTSAENGEYSVDRSAAKYVDGGSETPQHDESSHKAPASGHGHSHGSMNMHALILHVIGDALGNVGVISTGLVIWLSTWKYKGYFDPFISLVITVIIFSSALPLVRSASFILLQAVPKTISLEDVREGIQKVSGVLSVHELHVWQLSENKIVASVHVWVSRKREYMEVAGDIRKILHDHGVHSSTIQPEFHNAHDSPEEHLITDQETHCLIPCAPDEDCDPDNACCPPLKPPTPPLVDV